MNRRELVGGLAVSALSQGRVLGANDRVRIGLIGCGGRGRYVANFMRQAPGAEFVACCDAYAPNAEKARALLAPGASLHMDLRKLLERTDVDAVLIATPDHWHAPATIFACAAGKDAYVEKPLAHNVREGRLMIEAVRKHNRIVQVGTQHRSAPHFAECAEIVQSGQLGEVHFVRVWNYMQLYPKGIGRPADSDSPAGLNWDLYLGPAPQRPFNRARFLSTFRWFFDYAGGLITDFGTHRFDTVHQIMGQDRPLTVAASAHRYAQNDAGEMPDILQATYEYPGFILSYEACTLNSHGLGGRTPGVKYYHARTADDRPNGIAIYGTKGALFAERVGYEIYPEPIEEDLNGQAGAVPSGYRMARKVVAATDAVAAHAQTFVRNVRERKEPVANIEAGHRATLIGHLGNIAAKIGTKLRWDSERDDFVDAPEASKLLWREPRKPYDFWV